MRYKLDKGEKLLYKTKMERQKIALSGVWELPIMLKIKILLILNFVLIRYFMLMKIPFLD
jgi:hypothetical protein